MILIQYFMMVNQLRILFMQEKKDIVKSQMKKMKGLRKKFKFNLKRIMKKLVIATYVKKVGIDNLKVVNGLTGTKVPLIVCIDSYECYSFIKPL